ISFLAASPDGIVSSMGKLIGRMIEIKCPLTRKIYTLNETSNIYTICPIYYWAQVQLQLQCCDLEECDFWQCKIEEYDNYESFYDDTDLEKPFLSKESGLAKGCLVQYLPLDKGNNSETYNEDIYEYSRHDYPENICMTPQEAKTWAESQQSKETEK